MPISKWRPWRTEIPRDILQQKTKLGRAGTIYWVPADYNSAMWHSTGEYCVAARSYATEEECKNAAAVASATGGVPAPSARKKKVKAKRPKKKRKTPTKSGGKQEEEDAGEGDKEDTEKKDEVAVLVSGSESRARTQRATLDRDIGGSAALLLPVCAFVNAASFSSKHIFVRTFEGSFEEKSTTSRKHIFRAFRWLQAESKEPNPQKYLC